MILVTGGTGMAGSFVVRELRTRKYPVRILARPQSVATARDLGAEVVPGDLSDAESLRRAAGGVTGIVHVACTFGPPEVDITAMQVLLDAWDRGPFVFVSSLDVYGFAQHMPITEQHPLDPSYGDGNYARGKVACEGLLRETAAARQRSDWSILRAPHIWGPHPVCRDRLITARLREGRPIVLPGVAEAEWRQYGDAWVDARELAWIAAECLARPLSGAANVLNSHFCWHDIFETLISAIGSASRIEHKPLEAITDEESPRKQVYAQTWRYSNARLVQQLGFQPWCDWRATLAEVATPVPSAAGDNSNRSA